MRLEVPTYIPNTKLSRSQSTTAGAKQTPTLVVPKCCTRNRRTRMVQEMPTITDDDMSGRTCFRPGQLGVSLARTIGDGYGYGYMKRPHGWGKMSLPCTAPSTDCAGVSTPSKNIVTQLLATTITITDNLITERLARFVHGIPAIIKHTPITATPLKITCING
jgi:hypothetical protein